MFSLPVSAHCLYNLKYKQELFGKYSLNIWLRKVFDEIDDQADCNDLQVQSDSYPITQLCSFVTYNIQQSHSEQIKLSHFSPNYDNYENFQ